MSLGNTVMLFLDKSKASRCRSWHNCEGIRLTRLLDKFKVLRFDRSANESGRADI